MPVHPDHRAHPLHCAVLACGLDACTNPEHAPAWRCTTCHTWADAPNRPPARTQVVQAEDQAVLW